jgi:hypothetical protein
MLLFAGTSWGLSIYIGLLREPLSLFTKFRFV